jgi:hypothetical protein
MEMVKDYDDWYKNVMNEDNPDKYVLDSFLSVTKQFMNSPSSKACAGLFDIAADCTKKYILSKKKINNVPN